MICSLRYGRLKRPYATSTALGRRCSPSSTRSLVRGGRHPSSQIISKRGNRGARAFPAPLFSLLVPRFPWAGAMQVSYLAWHSFGGTWGSQQKNSQAGVFLWFSERGEARMRGGGSTARTPLRRHESAELCHFGGSQQKSPLKEEDSGERGEARIPSPSGDSQQQDFSERGEARTLNKRLKRPLLCH